MRSEAPASVIFLQDLSGSMENAGKIEISREVVRFFLKTAMEGDELLVNLKRGPLPAGVGGGYAKLAQPASGYAIVGVAAVVGRSGGSISHIRVGVTGLHEHAFRADTVESALLGSDGSASAIAAAAAHVNDDAEPLSDIHADGTYRAAMAVVYTRRAIEAALARAA